MKANPITVAVGGLLALVFGLRLFAFQVRQNEVAVVTTFGEYSRRITEPGLNWRLPWPVQKVYSFDKRIQNFERKFEQTTTKDGFNIIISVYCGWRISDPKVFMESFSGDMSKAEVALEPLLSNTKIGVLSQHTFSELVSTNAADLKFDEIEQQMLTKAQAEEGGKYGIEVKFLGIKQVGLPETITTKVFERMTAERQTKVKEFQSEGERQARIIRAEADNQASRVLADARAKVIEMTGSAEAKANEYYRVLQQNPELANFLISLRALEQSLRERTTLVLDPQTPPFNLLGTSTGSAAASTK